MGKKALFSILLLGLVFNANDLNYLSQASGLVIKGLQGLGILITTAYLLTIIFVAITFVFERRIK